MPTPKWDVQGINRDQILREIATLERDSATFRVLEDAGMGQRVPHHRCGDGSRSN
jgi:hypothetical protein